MALATQAAYIDTPYPPAGYHHLPSQPSAIADGRTDGPEDIQGGGQGGEADDYSVEYNMGLAHIIFNDSNKTLWCVTLSVVWFNTIRGFD